ncbi:hypothetical protein [Streptomyces sp. LS1784]|uniref:hypothetical protein n=1 Tax=Streptomyces sp. LS1784 TaxID=2851533 RepID=UPI001CCD7E55|nr:hypothetical protein [Streptomyces sp. LS1784]
MEREAIERLMALPEDALLKELGSSAHGAFPQDALARGAQIFARLQEAARQAICTNTAIQKVCQSGDQVALIGAITDLLATQFDVTPAGTVAVLLVRSGVANYCRVYWGPDASDGTDR